MKQLNWLKYNQFVSQCKWSFKARINHFPYYLPESLRHVFWQQLCCSSSYVCVYASSLNTNTWLNNIFVATAEQQCNWMNIWSQNCQCTICKIHLVWTFPTLWCLITPIYENSRGIPSIQRHSAERQFTLTQVTYSVSKQRGTDEKLSK